MRIIRQRAYARAGLVGNPSDGYHGKTVSIIVRNFHASVILYEWERIELLLSQEDQSRFDSIDDLVEDVELHGYYGGIRLVKATIKKFVEFCGQQRSQGHRQYELPDRKFAIRYESNIPRQVGLAGSSAIIVATLRALMKFYDVRIPQDVQPSLALSVETDELGIPAGLQDRVIQVYEGVAYMDFARESMHTEFGYECGRYEVLSSDKLHQLYIAYATEHGEPTEAVHNPLRARFEQGDQAVISAMDDFARYASEAKSTILEGNMDRLSQLVDQNFDTRRAICRLNDEHVRMVETARQVGASAKFAGSGGAIIGIYRDEGMFRKLKNELGKLHCQVFKPTISV